MAIPLDLRKRKISFFDLERKLFGLNFVEDIIESRIKFVKDISDHVEILRKFSSVFVNEVEEVYCVTEDDLESFSSDIPNKEVEGVGSQKIYKINLSKGNFRELAPLYSPNRLFFLGNGTLINNTKDNHYVSIDYNKILIGPVSEDGLLDELRDIGEVIALRKTKLDNYFSFSFKDPELCKSFVDVMTDARKDLPEVRFCYEDNFILEGFTGKYFSLPLACSLKTTRIVFLLNLDFKIEIYKLIEEKCKGADVVNVLIYNPLEKYTNVQIKSIPSKIFIECRDVDSAEIVYYSLGGLEIEGKVLVTGFYSEYNYYIGEYE